MAVDTKKSLRNQVLYSIYVRNYSKEGTFAAVQADLDRIKALGTDIIWLLPIHPDRREKPQGDASAAHMPSVTTAPSTPSSARSTISAIWSTPSTPAA